MVLAVISSGFFVTSEKGIIAEALGNPFITGLICNVSGNLVSFVETNKEQFLRNTPRG